MRKTSEVSWSRCFIRPLGGRLCHQVESLAHVPLRIEIPRLPLAYLMHVSWTLEGCGLVYPTTVRLQTDRFCDSCALAVGSTRCHCRSSVHPTEVQWIDHWLSNVVEASFFEHVSSSGLRTHPWQAQKCRSEPHSLKPELQRFAGLRPADTVCSTLHGTQSVSALAASSLNPLAMLGSVQAIQLGTRCSEASACRTGAKNASRRTPARRCFASNIKQTSRLHTALVSQRAEPPHTLVVHGYGRLPQRGGGHTAAEQPGERPSDCSASPVVAVAKHEAQPATCREALQVGQVQAPAAPSEACWIVLSRDTAVMAAPDMCVAR